jgi:hypothetical protein
VSAASLLDMSEDTDKKGKKYYKYELLVRSGEMFKVKGRLGFVLSEGGLGGLSEDTDKKGKKYYKYELPVRSGENI